MAITKTAILIASILLLAGTAVGEPTAAPSKCPSLDGDWEGDFDGAVTGTWSATFSQSGSEIRAFAFIRLDGGGTVEAEGSAGIKCDGRQTALAGSGTAKKKNGSFSGISNAKGTRISGAWWSGERGEFAGTWRGERVKP